MAAVTRTATFQSFFTSVKDTVSLALVTDFDGTLAPFQVDRDSVRPYPGAVEALLKLAIYGTKVIVVSGRAAHDVRRMLGVQSFEIWGSHGAEHLLPSGEYMQSDVPAHFDSLIEALDREQLSSLVEAKPFGVAVHWRGKSPHEASEIRFAAVRAFQWVRLPGIAAFDFDGGVEFRSCLANKGEAIRRIKSEHPSVPMLYLGDDLTDEDAFEALDDNDLGVLVRPEYRTTAAQVWLKPPEQLLSLFDFLALTMRGQS